jgi:hypothetical protein
MSLPTPLLITEAFGTGAGNPTYITLPIPVPSQIGTVINQASFTDGFPPATMTPEASGGLPFFGQDLNGILWMITAYIACFAAGQFSTYNSAQSSAIGGYPLGAMLLNANGDGFWLSTTAANTTDPDTGGAGWFPIDGVGASSVALSSVNVTLTALQSALPLIVFTGALTGNVVVTLPANQGQQWVIANNCTGSFTVSVQTSAGSPIVVPQTGTAAPTSVYCDGTYIQNTGVSTAGLAPLASPALTGTPTAPTAATSSNTTQIATTAFTKAALTAALATYAPLASPTFTGVPTAPTPSTSDSSLKLATTAFVKNAIAAAAAAAPVTVQAGLQGPMPSGTAFVTITYPTPFATATDGVAVSAAPTAGALITRDYSGSGPPTSKLGFQVASEAAGIYVSWVAVGH